MNICEDCDANGGERFLRDVVPGGPYDTAPGWDLPYELNPVAVEQDQEGFFDQVSEFMTSLTHKTLKDSNGEDMKVLHDTLKRYGTAINNVWADRHVPIPRKYQSLMRELLQEKKKKETFLKSTGELTDDCGREVMSFELYRALAWYFLKKGNMFAHLFLILCWNMMVRNCNCDDVVFINCIWTGDSFGVSVKRAKTNQDGSQRWQTDIKHIYANPFMPEICPILALAMYFVVYSSIGIKPGDQCFFRGKKTQTTFNDEVQKALSDPEFQRHLNSRGIPWKNVGAYSTRKGSTTYCTSGSINGPSIISVCLRAGWAIGPTLERYLRGADAGDQFCGRVVCGLPQLTKDFAVLPPHFRPVDPDVDSSIMDGLRLAFPYYDKWTASFQPVTMYMLASLCHHYDWMKTKLPVDHPVRGQRIFMDSCIPDLRALLAVGPEEAQMRPTGLPAWCKMFIKIDDLHRLILEVDERVKALPAQVKVMIESCFEARDIRNDTMSFSRVQQMMESNMLKMQDTLMGMMSTMIGHRGAPTPTVRTTGPPTAGSGSLSRRGWTIWMWGHDRPEKEVWRQIKGRYLPKNFRFSCNLLSANRAVQVDVTNVDITRKQISVQKAWTWWFFGIPYGDKVIRPLHLIDSDGRNGPKTHMNIKNSRKRFHELSKVVKGLVHLLETKKGVNVRTATDAEKVEWFLEAFDLMIDFIKTHHPNPKRRSPKKDATPSMAYSTLKRWYYEAKKASTVVS